MPQRQEGIENVALYWTGTENNPVAGNACYYPWCYKAHMMIVPMEEFIRDLIPQTIDSFKEMLEFLK